MVKYELLNKISPKLEESIPPMKGEVLFQMLNGHKNNDMDRTEREKEPILYGKTQIPTFAKIKDPYANDGKGGVAYVGVPMSTDANGVVTAFKPYLAGLHDGKFNGKFSLMEGKLEDEQLYKVFWLLNENASNPNRDTSVPPLFKIVNYKEETKNKIGQIDVLREALDTLKSMKESDYTEFANSQNYTETDQEGIKGQVSDFAKTYPDKFLAIVKDPDTKRKANLKLAQDKGILTFDARTMDVAVNGNKVMTLEKGEQDVSGAINLWLKSAKNGQSVYDGILKQLEG